MTTSRLRGARAKKGLREQSDFCTIRKGREAVKDDISDGDGQGSVKPCSYTHTRGMLLRCNEVMVNGENNALSLVQESRRKSLPEYHS